MLLEEATLEALAKVDWLALLLLLGAAYIIGSVPTSIWLSRAAFKQDVRHHGSKNAGSTNMYRVFGWKAGVPVQLIDIGKGALAALLPMQQEFQLWINPNLTEQAMTLMMLAAGIAAVLGHVYTVFANFKGGKGVNTMLGMMLAIAPIASLVCVGVFVATLLALRMVSAASITAVFAFPFFLAARSYIVGTELEAILVVVGVLLFVLVVYTHRSNIARIRKGEESKVSLFGSKR
jgi:glycerol-3-phosphate acyltransferase PlsY